MAHRRLDEVHRTFACAEYVEGANLVGLPREGIPDVAALRANPEICNRFRVSPVGEVLPPEEFYWHLANSSFPCIRGIRPLEQLSYAPQPDVIHDLFGHVSALGHPGYAELNRAFGTAFARGLDAEGREALSRLYWYTLEFGLVLQDGEVKAVGAELVSSCCNRGPYDESVCRPFSPTEAAASNYMVREKKLFLADSFDSMKQMTIEFLSCL